MEKGKLFSEVLLQFIEDETGVSELKETIRPIRITNEFLRANPK
jgi:hypothetical protein